jgi:enamine deaminase RidA (YjgF/YER057c/UK114 family)
VIIHAVKADEVWTVMDSGVPCGRGWRRGGSTYLIIQNIIYGRDIISTNMYPKVVIPAIPNFFGSRESFLRTKKDSGQAGMTVSENPKFLNCRSNSLPRPEQACLMLERAERILRENGASYSDVVRTWFYLSDILGWYAGFNKVRNEKYGEFGIMPGPGDRELLLPASTGIAGNSRVGAACAMDLIAVIGNNENGENTLHNTLPLIPSPQGRGNNPPSPLVGEGKGEGEHLTKTRPSIRRLTNPSQLDAFRYGSAFARASVLRNGSLDLIEVSGTAAIDEHGVSLYPRDIRAQIDCTLNKVQTLLAQEGAELKDICSATVFVKHGEYAETFYEMATARGLDNFPCVCVVADVCREELLFEMDAEAVVKTGVKDLRIQGVE